MLVNYEFRERFVVDAQVVLQFAGDSRHQRKKARATGGRP